MTQAQPSIPSAEPAAVRVAQAADEHDLMAMLTRMHADNPQPFPFDEEMVRAEVLRAIMPNRNAPDAGQAVCAIIGQPGRIEASIGLALSTTWYSPAPYLSGLWFHVVPEYRRKPHARDLILWSKTLADTLSMNLRIGAVLMKSHEAAAEDRLWKRHLGGEWCGSNYLYNPTAGAV